MRNREVFMKTIEPDDYFMPEPEVRRVTGLSRSTRWRLAQKGKFPRKYQTSENRRDNLASEVRNWVAERIAAA